jgi:hypothetical protein
MTTTEKAGRTDWFAQFERNRRPVAYGLIGLAVVLAIIPIWMIYKYHWEYATVAVWGAALAAISLGAAVWLLLSEQEPLRDLDQGRSLVLLVGSLSGFTTWLLSLALAYQWRATILGGLEAWQGALWWRIWVCILAMFGGLALMFLSLLPARVAERSSVGLRRLVYGFNATLTGLLLLGILLVVNVLVYNYFPTAWDWTQANIFTLNERSVNIIKSLDQPTKIFALVAGRNQLASREIRTLLDNARAVNSKITVKYLSPQLDEDEVSELMRRYQFTEPSGLLVVYGSDPNVQHQFIKMDEIFAPDPDAGPNRRGERFLFKGEDALVSSLSFLEEGKSKAVVYFLQGNGELDLTDSAGNQEGKGAGALRERLQRANYEIKGLQLTQVPVKSTDPSIVTGTRVPDDADVVVIAGPRVPLSDVALKALREYMQPTGKETPKKVGKLLVLADTVLDADKNVVQTGLDTLLLDYGVQLGMDRVLSLPTNLNRGNPLRIPVMVNPRARNPIATAFEGLLFTLPNLRSVESQAGNTPGPRFQAETLLQTYPDVCWAETNLRAEPVELARDLANDIRERKNMELVEKKLGAQKNIPVAVTVGEPTPPNPSDPHAFMRQGGDQKPRIVVFGGSTFASNRFMSLNAGDTSYNLFSSALSWLRERQQNIGLEPKRRNTFELKVAEEDSTRMHLLPAMFMLLGIIGLGTGVWLVRRR